MIRFPLKRFTGMRIRALLLFAPFAAVITLAAAPPKDFQPIKRSELRNRVRGGWAGQMIGVSYGAPTEFRYQRQDQRQRATDVDSGPCLNALDQDDLYVDMTFAKVLDDKGSRRDHRRLRRDVQRCQVSVVAREPRGAAQPAARCPGRHAGNPKYNAHANDIDFQIEADFIGLMAPGLYRSANDIAERAGRVMNYGDGIYGGMFVSGMYAAAFFENDPRKVVETGLASHPREEPVRDGDRGRSWLVEAVPRRLAESVAAARGQMGPPRSLSRRRDEAVQHRRQAERRLHRARVALRQ